MASGNVDDVNPPRSMKNIVLAVIEYVEKHQLPAISRLKARPTQFRIYDDALHAVWPELYKADRKAYTLVAVSIYIDIAERWGFTEIVPEELKELRL